MNTKTLSKEALDVIDQFLHFRLSNGLSGLAGEEAVVPVPYFNNKRGGIKTALRVHIGKGSPKEIFEEMSNLAKIKKVNISLLNKFYLTKFMVDQGIGIDCSGLAYYILNAESISRGKGSLDRHIAFANIKNIFMKLRAKMRPVENTSVAVLAHPKNSKEIPLEQIEPGDMIIFIKESRNHIAVVHQVEYQNFKPTTIHYTHAIAHSEDGQYGHGVRQGMITVADLNQPISAQIWQETNLKKVLPEYKVTIGRLAFL